MPWAMDAWRGAADGTSALAATPAAPAKNCLRVTWFIPPRFYVFGLYSIACIKRTHNTTGSPNIARNAMLLASQHARGGRICGTDFLETRGCSGRSAQF